MIKNTIFDTGIWIGAKTQKDQYSQLALSLFQNFAEKDIEYVHITDYVITESINFLLIKERFETAFALLEYFLLTDRIKIRYVDELMFNRIKELFEKYENLSITDCSLLALSEELKIKEIFSFDSGFDKVKGIKRLESLK